MTTKEVLHRLVDKLPEDELGAAERVLSALRDRATNPRHLRLLTVPADDEAETAEERAGSAEARAQIADGRTVTNEELRRAIGW
jgi:hypothetical protein